MGLQDHFPHFKAKHLAGVNTGYSQEKPPRLTRNEKKFCLNIWPDQSPNPQCWADCVIQRQFS